MLRLETDRAHRAAPIDDGVGRPEAHAPRLRALAAIVDGERVVDLVGVDGGGDVLRAARCVVNAEDHEAIGRVIAHQRDILGNRGHARAAPGRPEVDHDDAAVEVRPEVALAVLADDRFDRGRVARPAGRGDGRRWLAHHRAMRVADRALPPEPLLGKLARGLAARRWILAARKRILAARERIFAARDRIRHRGERGRAQKRRGHEKHLHAESVPRETRISAARRRSCARWRPC